MHKSGQASSRDAAPTGTDDETAPPPGAGAVHGGEQGARKTKAMGGKLSCCFGRPTPRQAACSPLDVPAAGGPPRAPVGRVQGLPGPG